MMLESNLNSGTEKLEKSGPVHPGKILGDKLTERSWTPRELARWSGLSPVEISQITIGKRSITAEAALRFSAWLGTDPSFWMGLQSEYDLEIAKQDLARVPAVELQPETEIQSRSIKDMSSDEARAFLLKPESYCTIHLPNYFDFSTLLEKVREVLAETELSRSGVRDVEGVNHRIMTNKDGRFAWRPLELVHPALYVSLVNSITEGDHWQTIQNQFLSFSQNDNIICLSLPVESLTDDKDNAAQIRGWLTDVEQRSIELSLDYEFLIQADIEDCYPSIYSHSIAWALHGKETAKSKRRDMSLIGNIIDSRIQDMHLGQTNGIPQGSVLMDFVSEMVLGYADTELAKRCKDDAIEDYKILRYRDDFRIFVNSPPNGDRILKHLTEVLIELGLKLNPAKTDLSSVVVRTSIKDDKLAWIFRKQRSRNLRNSLLMIHDHGMAYPNSGGFMSALLGFHQRLHRLVRYESPLALAAIAVDIAVRNPRTYPTVAAILGELIKFIRGDWEKLYAVDRIRRRFAQVANSGYMDIWLQRISYQYDPTILFDENLCKLVSDGSVDIWSNSWVHSPDVVSALDVACVVDRNRLWEMEPTIPPEELRLFKPVY